jgi:hypothetical protein
MSISEEKVLLPVRPVAALQGCDRELIAILAIMARYIRRKISALLL